jgi:hypothetical protein
MYPAKGDQTISLAPYAGNSITNILFMQTNLWNKAEVLLMESTISLSLPYLLYQAVGNWMLIPCQGS